MTWTKLSDDFTDDCWTLSDAAFRLHVDALVWSNRKLLDCRIPAEDVPRISKAADAVAELLAVGWWTYSDEDGTYTIRHHALYQRTREQTVAIQERNQRNGAKGGRPAKPGREQHPPVTQAGSQMGSQVETQVETQRDGTGQDGIGSEPATQLEITTRREEELTRTHAREDADCIGCQQAVVFPSRRCQVHERMSA